MQTDRMHFINYCFWNRTVPVMVGLVLCGVQAILFPETQYEYDK
jgi:hypothetical protein